jgi:chitinase
MSTFKFIKRAMASMAMFGLLVCTSCSKSATNNNESEETEATEPAKVIVAYVTANFTELPDPSLMTHINYAFGHVNSTFNGVDIDKPENLKKVVALKEQNPELKVMLSVGGWTSGNFSEMAADSVNRITFAKECKKIVDEFGLDGIDIDWEYPTSSEAGISSNPNDTDNYTLLMRDLRQELGKDKWVTLATIWSAKYIDFKAIDQYIDLVNVMSYDMKQVPGHQCPLYESEKFGDRCADNAIKLHLAAGVPVEKLVMGIPFYGRGCGPYTDYVDFKDFYVAEGCTMERDSVAHIPYIADKDGNLVLGYEDVESATEKCEYALDKNLRGVMYWEYNCDSKDHTLAKLLAKYFLPKK